MEGRLYEHKLKTIDSYLDEIYLHGLQKNSILNDKQLRDIVSRIGLFRLKGYVYAFKDSLEQYSIDDVLNIYYFDKFLTRHTMDLTFSVETMLKTRLIENCYSRTDNPFFYLIKSNYKIDDFYLNKAALKSWKVSAVPIVEQQEIYSHYCIYYKQRYVFEENRQHYLRGVQLITLYENINYPPFHYFVESATLGTVIYLIKNLKIENYDILRAVGRDFGVKNPRTFEPYLDRLNEVRNRAAHRERLFNRSYRSVVGVAPYDRLRIEGCEHRFADIYLFLFYMLGRLDGKETGRGFFEKEIMCLLDDYQHDRLLSKECFGINKNLKESMRKFIYKGVCK